MALRARTFTYAVSVDENWTSTSDKGGTPIPDDEAWSPEHLVLAGLARCTLKSLSYHAQLRGLGVTSHASANGVVTKRESDGRYAFVEIKVRLEASFEPAPSDLPELLALAERDCFVGASLTVDPDYRWTVDGEAVA
jgi:organic hydroperoxide reductase OsmC/OhrA